MLSFVNGGKDVVLKDVNLTEYSVLHSMPLLPYLLGPKDHQLPQAVCILDKLLVLWHLRVSLLIHDFFNVLLFSFGHDLFKTVFLSLLGYLLNWSLHLKRLEVKLVRVFDYNGRNCVLYGLLSFSNRRLLSLLQFTILCTAMFWCWCLTIFACLDL